MVSAGQLTGMAASIILPIMAALIPYILLKRRSSKVETGMIGAVGYGILGFLWQQLIYLVVIVLLTNFEWLRNAIGNIYLVSALVYGIVCSIFVALGMYWGAYLTNQKQHSLYRTTAIGIGFGLGSLAWNIGVPYAMSFYNAIRINLGSYSGSAELKNSILSTSAVTMYLDAYKCILMILIYTGVALLLGKFYLEKKKLATWMTPILCQLFISLSNAVMRQYLPDLVSKIGIYVILTIMAAVSCYLLYNWLVKGKIVVMEMQ